MKLDDHTVQLAGLLVAIGQLIIAAIDLSLNAWRIHMTEQTPNNPQRNLNREGIVIAFLALFGVLAIASVGIYWVTILISTSKSGTLTELVTRAAALATFLGLGAGIFIGQWLPKALTRLIRR